MVALEEGKGVSTRLFSKPGEKYFICQQGCWWIFVSQQHGLGCCAGAERREGSCTSTINNLDTEAVKQ